MEENCNTISTDGASGLYSDADFTELSTESGDYSNTDFATYAKVIPVRQFLSDEKYSKVPVTTVTKDDFDATMPTNEAILEHFSSKIRSNGIGAALNGLRVIATRLIKLDGEDARLSNGQKETIQTAYLIELIGAWETVPRTVSARSDPPPVPPRSDQPVPSSSQRPASPASPSPLQTPHAFFMQRDESNSTLNGVEWD